MEAEFPEKLGFLFEPARALLLQAKAKRLRVGCFREVQKSIKDSVHRLLSDQIEALGLGWFFDVLETEIRGKNGSNFVFAGLAQHTVESIKSFEGLDRAWIEEAQAVSKRSRNVLVPTIRKDGSEIWVSYNPELDTDETHQRFVVNPPDDAIVAQVNYSDNPWFPEVLEKERLHCKMTNAKDYDNIWEGKCKPAVAGAIYYDEMEKVVLERRICNVPYDPMLKVHVVFDLGWNDSMAISLVQKHVSELRIIEYIEDSHKTLDYYSALLKERRFNWGRVWLPHDGFSSDYKTGKSAEKILTALGWDVATREEITELSIEAGIKLTRMTFGRMYFDKGKTERLMQCAKRYRRSINQQTNEPGAPFHDEWSHGADNLRYIAVNADQMTNEDWVDDEEEPEQQGRSAIGGY
jgi:phage terminase large subunit